MSLSLSIQLKVSSKVIHLVICFVQYLRCLEWIIFHIQIGLCVRIFVLLLRLALDALSFKRIIDWNEDTFIVLLDYAFLKHGLTELSVILLLLVDLLCVMVIRFHLFIIGKFLCNFHLFPLFGFLLIFDLCFRSSSLRAVLQQMTADTLRHYRNME